MENQEVARIEPPVGSPAEANGSGAGASAGQRLELVSRGAIRPARPVTNLAKVFGQFVEVQHQVTEQVLALEESVSQEREALAAAVAQIPEFKERINWLISSYYELGQKDAVVEQRMARQDEQLAAVSADLTVLNDNDAALAQRLDQYGTSLAALASNVQTLIDGRSRWDSTMDQMIELLLEARRSAPPAARTAHGDNSAEVKTA